MFSKCMIFIFASAIALNLTAQDAPDLEATGKLAAATLETMAGGDTTIAAYKGKVLLLDFWATWCKPCLKAMPELQTMHSKLGPDHFNVLGVSIDEGKDPRPKIKRMLEKLNVSYPILLDNKPQKLWQSLKLPSVPAIILVNDQGQVIGRWTGLIDIKEVERAVQAQLAQKK